MIQIRKVWAAVLRVAGPFKAAACADLPHRATPSRTLSPVVAPTAVLPTRASNDVTHGQGH